MFWLYWTWPHRFIDLNLNGFVHGSELTYKDIYNVCVEAKDELLFDRTAPPSGRVLHCRHTR